MATFWQHLFEKNHKNNKILKNQQMKEPKTTKNSTV